MARHNGKHSDPDNVPSSSTRSVPDDIDYRDADPEVLVSCPTCGSMHAEVPIEELDTFVIAGRDDRGAHMTVNISMPPSMVRAMQIIVRSLRFPYIDVAALVRHAVKRHLYWTTAQRNSIEKHILPSLESIMEVARDDDMRTRVEEALARTEAQIDRHMRSGESAEALKMLGAIRSKLDGVQDSTWTRRFKGEIEHKYRDCFNANGAVKKPSEYAATVKRVGNGSDVVPDDEHGPGSRLRQ